MRTRKKQGYVAKFPSRNPLYLWRAVLEGIGEDIGIMKTFRFFFLSMCSDPLLKPVYWNPALILGLEPENFLIYRNHFRQLKWFINLYRNLLNEFGEDIAQYLTAKMAFAIAVPHFFKTFRSLDASDDLIQFRQNMSQFLGHEGNISWSETPPGNINNVYYRISRCVHVEILKVYGLKVAASAFCLSDHVTFNHSLSKLIFIRNSCIGIGDDCCNLQFILERTIDQTKDEEHSGDIYKADFNATRLIRLWREKMYPALK